MLYFMNLDMEVVMMTDKGNVMMSGNVIFHVFEHGFNNDA